MSFLFGLEIQYISLIILLIRWRVVCARPPINNLLLYRELVSLYQVGIVDIRALELIISIESDIQEFSDILFSPDCVHNDWKLNYAPGNCNAGDKKPLFLSFKKKKKDERNIKEEEALALFWKSYQFFFIMLLFPQWNMRGRPRLRIRTALAKRDNAGT